MLRHKLFYEIKERLEKQTGESLETRTQVCFSYDGGAKTIILTWNEELPDSVLEILGRATARVKTH